ncbi:hypothetical protein [Hymenobacter metallilatus]|uniref:Uncharacterized protein n=1 Tax=Hymenobacter metallilatus TaxID=2493666 RepID=A0A428IXT4_9BACT|nr:hypothetical protein [Hymenobacter metallilatus]RSK23893.1 hypothetical protein EI290_21605 [Hymenobacter metallilatus]
MTWEFGENPPFQLSYLLPSSEKLVAWQMLQEKLPIASVLTGKIFARTHFGIFFDAHIGFAVRMNVPDFGKAEGGMIFPDDYPPLGSEISGRLTGFDTPWHQVVVGRI